jgi:hypothetical protein
MFKIRSSVYQKTKFIIQHFLLEHYLDTEFLQLQKLSQFEHKQDQDTVKDCKLVELNGRFCK